MKFDITKQTEKVKFTLEKKGIPNVKAAVVLNLDVSGSARGLFSSGQMQAAFELVVPLAINLDDNQSLPVFTFASGSDYVTEITPEANASNYADYIQENILNPRKGVKLWGATTYAEVIEENLKTLGYVTKGMLGFGGRKVKKDNGSGYPSFVITFTDGANSDQSSIKKLLQECQDAQVQTYFLFVGINQNPSEFKNIVRLGDDFDNVAFVSVTDLAKFAESDDIYDLLIPQELVEWFKK